MIIKRRTVKADRYSIKILILNKKREKKEVDHKTSLEWLAKHHNGRISARETQEGGFGNHKAMILDVNYALPDGEVVSVSFDWYFMNNRPKKIDVTYLTEISHHG